MGLYISFHASQETSAYLQQPKELKKRLQFGSEFLKQADACNPGRLYRKKHQEDIQLIRLICGQR